MSGRDEEEAWDEVFCEDVKIDDEAKPCALADSASIASSVRTLRYYQERGNKLREMLNAEIARLKAVVAAKTAVLDRNAAYLEGCLLATLDAQEKISIPTPYGTIVKVKGRERFVKPEGFALDEFNEWRRKAIQGSTEAGVARPDDWLLRRKVTEEIDVAAVKKYIKESGGEVPDGIDFEYGPDTLSLRQ